MHKKSLVRVCIEKNDNEKSGAFNIAQACIWQNIASESGAILRKSEEPKYLPNLPPKNLGQNSKIRQTYIGKKVALSILNLHFPNFPLFLTSTLLNFS